MKKLFMDVIADESFRTLNTEELLRHAYAAKYYSWQGTEPGQYGIELAEFQSRRREMLALIEKANSEKAARKPAASTLKPSVAAARARRLERRAKQSAPQLTCRICGKPATMNASLGPACPEHYDDLSG